MNIKIVTSYKEFDGYKFRAKVEYSMDGIGTDLFDVYTHIEYKFELESRLRRNFDMQFPDNNGYLEIIYWCSKEEDDAISKLLEDLNL